MSLLCGIIDATPAWLQLLEQEGVPWVRFRPEMPDTGLLSAVIVDRPLLDREESVLRSYMASGGAILGAARHPESLTGKPWRSQNVRYLTDTRSDGPSWVDLLDVNIACQIPREANMLKTNDGTSALFAGEWGGGAMVVLPFDVRDIWFQTAAQYRMFPSPFERLPYERVAAAGRSDLLRLVHCSLEFLHHLRGKPYARLSPYPAGVSAVVAYRLDTDKASPRQIDAFRALSESLRIPFTWFVDTGSHLGWLERFAEMRGQEIGIHCRFHRDYAASGGYKADILEARKLLERAGTYPAGYAAPYGTWNSALGEALDELDLPFSSEFGIGYDTFPFRPEVPGRQFRTLQVPVHPVSSGALRRAGYPPARMEQYYSEVIRRKTMRGDPLFLYDHPLHENLGVGRAVLEEALRKGASPVTLGGFARWWLLRCRLLLQLGSPGITSAAAGQAAAEAGMCVRVSSLEGEAEVPLGESFRPESVRLPREYRSAADIGRTREFDLRTAIGSAVTAAMRWRKQ